MSQLDFSEGELLDAMSSISTTFTDSIGTASPPLNPAASLHNSTEGKKHPTFYFSDFINVQVEHMVYSFPSALIDSSNLKEKVKGLRGNECLSVEGIPHREVQAFLEVADARLVSGDKHFTFQQWASALSVANHLEVAEISTYVAKSIEDGLTRLDPFDCIQAAEIHRAQDWLLQPFRRTCERRDPLSPSEMLLLGLDRAGAIARARENLMRTIYSKGLFDALYGSSELSSSAQTTLDSHALQAVKGETLLCQLPSEQQLTRGARDDHQNIYPNHLMSSNLTVIKVQDSLYRLPLHYFGNQSLIHKLAASNVDRGPVILPNDTSTSKWEIFLQIITARPYDQSEPSLTFSEWMSGLRLAKELDHGYAPAYIFGRIQKDYPSQDPVDLLEAAGLVETPPSSWMQGRYAILSQRMTAILSEEMRRIGVDASAEVCKMREQAAYDKGKTEGVTNYICQRCSLGGPNYPAPAVYVPQPPYGSLYPNLPQDPHYGQSPAYY